MSVPECVHVDTTWHMHMYMYMYVHACHMSVPECVHVDTRSTFVLILTVRGKPYLLFQVDAVETSTGIDKWPGMENGNRECE